MEHLNPCPFCGNTSDTHTPDGKNRVLPVTLEETHFPESYGLHLTEAQYFHVKCKLCGACGGVGVAGFNGLLNKTVTEDQAKEIAISKWNTRA